MLPKSNCTTTVPIRNESNLKILEPLEHILNGDDEETQNCFLTSDHTEDAVDTGGITIPAGLELQQQ